LLQRLVQHNNYSQHSGSPDRAAITVAKFLGGATGGLVVQAFAPDAKMYGAVVIARMVREEPLRSPASDIVRAWITKAPSWLEVRTPVNAPTHFHSFKPYGKPAIVRETCEPRLGSSVLEFTPVQLAV